MPEILEERHLVKLKLALAGPAGAGKGEILRQLAKQKGSRPLQHRRVGETDVYQASWEWRDIPVEGWITELTAYTTIGHVEFNAITEMLLDGVDGIIFVAPVDPERAEEIKESLQSLIFNLTRYDREIGDVPIILHYHRAENLPGFDPVMLDQYLGLEEGAIPRFVTRSEGDDLTVSFVAVVGKLLENIDLPTDEQVGKEEL